MMLDRSKSSVEMQAKKHETVEKVIPVSTIKNSVASKINFKK